MNTDMSYSVVIEFTNGDIFTVNDLTASGAEAEYRTPDHIRNVRSITVFNNEKPVYGSIKRNDNDNDCVM